MPAPETLLRAWIKSVVEDEFSTEGFTVADDKLPRAAGMDGATHLACYPETAGERPQHAIQLDVRARLQLYMAYDASPDETIQVDPSVIEGYADRLRRAFKDNSDGDTSDLWFLRLVNIDYPDDPTGNKSRLEASFQAFANNEAALG